MQRGTGKDIKGKARIICPDKDVEFWSKPENQGWAMEYVRASVEILPPNSPAEYLGAIVGGAPEMATSMAQALRRTKIKREANHTAALRF